MTGIMEVQQVMEFLIILSIGETEEILPELNWDQKEEPEMLLKS